MISKETRNLYYVFGYALQDKEGVSLKFSVGWVISKITVFCTANLCLKKGDIDFRTEMWVKKRPKDPDLRVITLI